MKNRGVHKRIFTEDVLLDDTPLYYMVEGKEVLRGFKVAGGIHCCCCDRKVSPTEFENHAGYGTRKNPYYNIFTPDDLTLKEIAQQCIPVVETSVPSIGGCAVCSSRDFTKKAFGDKDVIICDQCVKEYTVGCLRRQKMIDIKALPGSESCCLPCRNINNILKMVMGKEELKLSEVICSSVKQKYEQALDMNQMLDIRWRLLKGEEATKDTIKLFSDAVSIFHDHINPINDPTNASFDLINHMVFGQRYNGQDYGGMYCAILMVNSNVVGSAIFRVFGDGTAEIPLVSTKDEYEIMGQILLDCTDKLFQFLNVKEEKNPSLLAAALNHIETMNFGHTGTPDFGSRK